MNRGDSTSIASALPPENMAVVDRAGESLVVDSLRIPAEGHAVLFAMLSSGGTDDLRFVPLDRQSSVCDVSCPDARATAGAYCALLNALSRESVLTTCKGGRVVFDDWMPNGPANPFTDFVPFGEYSTNAVATVRRGPQRLVHKAFRFARTHNRELDLCRGSPVFGRLLGAYRYVDSATGVSRPLGFLRAFVEGDTLDRPLRASLRRLLSTDCRSAVNLDEEQSLLRRVGGSLFALQNELREHSPLSAPSFAYSRIEADVDEKSRTLVTRIRQDGDLSASLRCLLSTSVRDLARAKCNSAVVTAGGMHGDLHLGHIIVSGGDIRFIDFGDFDSSRDGTTTPWKDLVSLVRALEYFSHDELCFAAAERGLGDQLSIARSFVSAELANGSTAAHGLLARTAAWRAKLWQALLDGFCECGSPAIDAASMRVLYLQRLFHELLYNYECGRPFYKWFDLFFVLQTTKSAPCKS